MTLTAAAHEVERLRRDLDTAEGHLAKAVTEARAQGQTWDVIGKATNTNRATIHRWWTRKTANG